VATTTVYVIRDEHQQNLKSINNKGNKNGMSFSFLPLLVLQILAGGVVTLER